MDVNETATMIMSNIRQALLQKPYPVCIGCPRRASEREGEGEGEREGRRYTHLQHLLTEGYESHSQFAGKQRRQDAVDVKEAKRRLRALFRDHLYASQHKSEQASMRAGICTSIKVPSPSADLVLGDGSSEACHNETSD
jgi:hypothetical protein